MKEILRNKNLAFIGGGIACKAILQILLAKTFSNEGWDIIGVADINNKAEGLLYARAKGIYTTLEYKDLYGFKELDLIFELTGDDKILEEIRATKPSDVVLIDHFEAMSVWDFLQIEEMRVRIRGKLRKLIGDPEKVETEFDLFSQQLGKIVKERTRHLQSVEKELVERDRVLSQIVQGNTIPTFVINRDHIVTHWNRACEKLTGYKADEIVGTTKQWMPFRPFERPSMADVIVDEMEEKEIERYYGDKWRKSALIEGAYEAEEFFLNMGENGKWLFFTAAPLKDPGGKTIGAIETLWDRTEDKNAEEERERHNRELSALSSITEALSMSLDLENRLKAAVLEIFKSLPVDSVCIFILEADGSFSLRYYYGISEVLFQKKGMMETEDIMYRMAQRREPTIFEDISENDKADIGLFVSEGLKSLAYVPIRAEEEKLLGVIRMGSKNSKIFAPEEKRILGLIGNRIAVAIESSTFHEEHMKSEERYRLLFNTNPNPIFIVDRETFEIMDVNARAQDCYRYSKDELLGMNYLDLEDRGNELIEDLEVGSDNQPLFYAKRQHLKKGGEIFHVNVHIGDIKYREREAFIITTTDISESMRKEAQLIQAGKMTTVGIMASGMAHELNQPLSVIQVCSDYFHKMIGRGKTITNEELETMAGEINKSVDRATEIIKHMRDFSRQSEIVKNKVDINEPIRDVFKILGQQLKVHEIEVELDLQEGLPEIMADHNRLEQVFLNLVINAMDAMDEKGKEMGNGGWQRLLRIRSFAERGNVVVTVSDTGTGIPEEMINKIFEPFFTTKEVGKGTGLGISISYGIVKDYNGSIKVESELGQGTTFELRFPTGGFIAWGKHS